MHIYVIICRNTHCLKKYICIYISPRFSNKKNMQTKKFGRIVPILVFGYPFEIMHASHDFFVNAYLIYIMISIFIYTI
jgi:hypothetical protein